MWLGSSKKLVFRETEALLDYFGGGPPTTGLDLGGTGLLPDYMSSGPTGATYLPDLYRLPYPVEDLAVLPDLRLFVDVGDF